MDDQDVEPEEPHPLRMGRSAALRTDDGGRQRKDQPEKRMLAPKVGEQVVAEGLPYLCGRSALLGWRATCRGVEYAFASRQ